MSPLELYSEDKQPLYPHPLTNFSLGLWNLFLLFALGDSAPLHLVFWKLHLEPYLQQVAGCYAQTGVCKIYDLNRFFETLACEQQGLHL